MVDHSQLEEQVRQLARRLRRTQTALALFVAAVAALLMLGSGEPPAPDAVPRPDTAAELRTRRLVVVDDQGVARVVIGQDPKDTERRSRAAGITIHDRHGHERGGMSTFDDDSVVLALDAPKGVGDPMRDRLGLSVYPNGAAAITLINNQTLISVRLISEADGTGGVEFIDYDLPNRKAAIKRLSFKGESVQEIELERQ